MLLCRIAVTVFALLIVHCLAADQDILTILSQQTDIATFTGILEKFPDLVDILNQGTFSLLVPNDQAIALYNADNPQLEQDEDNLRAIVLYHITNGTHPSATFGLQPLFVPTLLTNSSYTNVTGGQVVEIASQDNKPTVVSGVKAVSHVVEADIFYIGGLIHIIDTVLTIPISFPATITKAGLTDLVALLSKGGWLTPSSPAAAIVNNLQDLTVFGPNNPNFGATFTGFDGLSETDLLSIFRYSISQGPVLYSSEFKNNSKIPTLENKTATMTELNGGFYVDASLITTRDFLTSNGVLQILDSPLNPNTTGARPVQSSPASSSKGSNGLSAAAGAGIGIVIGALVLGGALIVALYIRTKRRRASMPGGQRLDGESHERVAYRSDPNEPPPTYELDTKSIAGGAATGNVPTTRVYEIHHSPKPPSPLEIDGTERSRISITIEGSPPRHLGFQARY
ncbi:uncharacterized protein Z518_06970 [Rhinocladiella mackenziei CBS 650.93]|uniref:FAS1 domain-containing protein n=1 Tax=Rhinocladiella mackenziei CBS 650.93 TaxID=1442369 RepID=A0A0D2GZ28_9EURO|nr:uncharacterized protein Z518_06970 [Rhinocladiella mackenziei CBS 650.93]KIX03418.1 hypothetical protein Z518_06970 [Rhinocladiella mackenziei CBS 650.93]